MTPQEFETKLEGLWNSDKWFKWIVLFLLLPLIIVIFFRKAIIEILVHNSKEIFKKTTEQNAELQTKIEETKQESAAAVQKAKDDQTKIDDRKEDDVPLDWNKTEH